MIDFSKGIGYGRVPRDDRRIKDCERSVALIKQYLGRIDRDKFELGVELLRWYKSGNYLCQDNEQDAGRWFFDICDRKLQLEKSMVSRYINIVDEFGEYDSERECYVGLAKKWQEYSWSALVELLPMSEEQREEVRPYWTVKEIRDYKKRFGCDVATDKKDCLSEQDFERLDEIIKGKSTESTDDWEEPERYRSMSRRELVERIESLEAERLRLCQLLIDAHNEERDDPLDFIDADATA